MLILRSFALATIAVSACLPGLRASAIPVAIQQEDDRFILLRGGDPYYVEGAGGVEQLPAAAAVGANSTRTWNHHRVDEVLAEAHSLGLTVTVGFWLSHQASDYESSDYRNGLIATVREVVTRHRDHPAVLLWAIGNEIDIGANIPAAWSFVNELALLVKSIDPLHPTMTVIAGPSLSSMNHIADHAPAIDVLGVNAYDGISVVPATVARSRFAGPYLVTEWGPRGHWEVATTPWRAPWEQTSEEKLESYERAYREFIKADVARCLGSYVFLWGQKQERTPTWYGVFAEANSPAGVDGERMPVYDLMTELWTGQPPVNRAPVMAGLWLNGTRADPLLPIEQLRRRPGETFEVEARVTDREGDPLQFNWELLHEATRLGVGGSFEPRPERVEGAITSHPDTPHRVQVTVPASGHYRLFAYALDGQGGLATANFPFSSVLPDSAP